MDIYLDADDKSAIDSRKQDKKHTHSIDRVHLDSYRFWCLDFMLNRKVISGNQLEDKRTPKGRLALGFSAKVLVEACGDASIGTNVVGEVRGSAES